MQSGNFLTVEDPEGRLAAHAAFTLYAFVQAAGRHCSAAGRPPETASASKSTTGAIFAFRVSDRTAQNAVTAPVSIMARTWYLVIASFDPTTRQSSIAQHAVVGRYIGLLSKIVPLDYDGAADRRLAICPSVDGRFIIGGAQV